VATPVLTRPIEFGADIVMHSATKYLNGHSDLIAGALVGARDDEHWAKLRTIRAQLGMILARPRRGSDAWHAHAVPRVQWACRSAQTLAEKFAAHPMVSEVLYPAALFLRPRRRQEADEGRFRRHAVGARQRRRARAIATAARVDLWKRATSLGGVESLIEHRASIEGPGTPCPLDLLRLSVGVEDTNDLYGDLDQALKRAHNA